MPYSILICEEAHREVLEAYQYYQSKSNVKLRNFPYLIVYEYYNNSVIIYSVFNGYKKPKRY